MKSFFILFLGVLIAAFLLASMIMFQVRYDQVAVRTTFGGADQGSVITEPGLYFRWPPPIQQVHGFSKQVQILEDQLEELQTIDGYSVISRTYLAWHIDNPLDFYVNLKNIENARDQLRPLLRDLRKIFGRYRFDQLVNNDPTQLKLAEIEHQALTEIQAYLTQNHYGISVDQVGIRRLVLPEQVTAKVFERMRQTRQTLAQNARSEGEQQAVAIKSKAEATRDIILAFAQNRAQAIRTQGDLEAAEYYKAFQADQDLAIFLRKMETLRKVLAQNATIVMDAKELGLEQLIEGGQQPAASRP
ncbi:MAG: protease modulator HflC [Phycisphaeraceae bacterium]